MLRNPTAKYVPSSWLLYGSLNAASLDGKPFFTWFDVPRMVRDGQVRFIEKMWRAPFQQVKFAVKAEDRRVQQFVAGMVKKWWQRSWPRQLSKYFRFGFAPGAAEFGIGRGNRIMLERVKAIEPTDAQPRVYIRGRREGQFAGMTAKNIHVSASHAMWFSGYQEFSPWYDFPPIAGLFDPWLEKNSRNGATDMRVLFMRKNSSRGSVLYYPPGVSKVGTAENPRVMDNQDVARSVVDYGEAGSTYCLENSVFPGTNIKQWELVEPTAAKGDHDYLEYPKVLDREMLSRAGIPPEVIEAAEVGSGWSGRMVPLLAFLGGVDELSGLGLESFEPVLRYAVAANFSPKAWYEVEALSLCDQVRQQGQAGKGGTEGANPIPKLLGQGGKGDQDQAQEQPTSTTREMSDGRSRRSKGSPIPPEIARRVKRILTQRLRRGQERELSWTQYTGPKGGHGWKNDSGEVLYQAEAPAEHDKHDGSSKGVDRVADSKAGRILRAIGKLPGKVVKQAREKVASTYSKLEGRYGKGYARAIVAAGVAGLPVPLPGASVAMAAPLLAVAELHRRIRGTPQPANLDPGVVKKGSSWFLGRIFGKIRDTFNLSEDRTDGGGDLHRLLGYVMLTVQEQYTAAGKPDEAEPILRHLADLADDPDRLRSVLETEMSWSEYTGPKGGKGWKNDETGRIKYGGSKPGEKKEKQQASASRASELTTLVLHQAATKEHLAELVTHLPALTVEQLHDARAKMGASFGGSRVRRKEMVDKLLHHVNDLVAEERAQQPPTPAPAPTDGIPENPEHGKAYRVPTDSLHVDPARFQYKLGTDKAGVTQELKGVEMFNPELAGVVSLWKDPENGKSYVVNGHHRHELATRTGAPHMNAIYIDAKDAKEARARGALVNIAEGRGTAIDAAKFLRDTGLTPDEVKAKGISLKGKLADDAGILTHLNDKAFDRLARGQEELPHALAIARHVKDPARQERLFEKIRQREEAGKDTSPRHLEEMARQMAAAPSSTSTEQTLWGDETNEEDTFDERAELASAIRSDLAREVNDFAAGASERRAEKLGEHGNVLDVETNRGLKEKSEQAKNLFDTLAHRKGPISDALNAGSIDLKRAKSKKEKDDVRKRTSEAVRSAIAGEFAALDQRTPAHAGGEGASAGGSGEGHPSGGGVPPDAAAGDAGRVPSEPAGLDTLPPAADPFTHASADQSEAIRAIPRDSLGWVAGHLVRHTPEGQFQVETVKGYKTGTPEEIGQHINDAWRFAAIEKPQVHKALTRAAEFHEPDWFGGGDAAGEVARRRAAVPAGARGVSLEPNTRGRTGVVVRDEEGATHLRLDGGSEIKATDFEPLESQFSWRVPEVKREPVAKPVQTDMFLSDGRDEDLPFAEEIPDVEDQ